MRQWTIEGRMWLPWSIVYYLLSIVPREFSTANVIYRSTLIKITSLFLTVLVSFVVPQI